MKKVSLVFLLAGLSANLAVATAPLKIGYVNFDVALSQEKEAMKHTAELQEEKSAIAQAELKAQNDIQQKMADYQKNAVKLSEKAKQDQQTALGNEINSLQTRFTQRREALNKRQGDILADLENKNRLLLESISRKEGYLMVFNSAALVYASDEIKKNDITPKLVVEYNKAYPVKEIKKPAPVKEINKPAAPVKEINKPAAPVKEINKPAPGMIK